MTKKLVVVGEAEEGAIQQAENCLVEAEAMLLMADNHQGYGMPVGGVAVYKDRISPAGVGFDISCLDAETEFLTPTGWKKISEWDNDLVLAYFPYTDGTYFVMPEQYIVTETNKFYHFNHAGALDQMVTPDHRMIIWKGYPSRGYNVDTIVAEDLVQHHYSLAKGIQGGVKTTFSYGTNNSLDYTNEEIAVLVMISADGRIKDYLKTNNVELHFKKLRKIIRAKMLLDNAGISYNEYLGSDGSTWITFTFENATKDLNIFWGASEEQLHILAEECMEWDGHKGNHTYYSTTVLEHAEIVQFALTISGYRAEIYLPPQYDETHKQTYHVYITKNEIVTFTKNCITEVHADNMPAYCFSVPSGYFIARRNNHIFITGNCGNAAVKTDIYYQDLKPYISSFADLIWGELSFGIGRKNEEEVEHELFDSPVWELAPYAKDSRIKAVARDQLGTIGSGNHYVDVFYDEDGMVWVGVHFGSRGLGHKTASYYMREAGDNTNIMHETPHTLDVNSQLGQDYIAAMQLCGQYAYAGRDWVCDKVVSLLGGNVVDYVHNHHNYAWEEEHFGDMYWVVRKGATPAFPNQRGFIGGSMMDNAVIVQGVDSPDSENLYYSTVHGAGRVMSRTQASGKTKKQAVWACGNRDCANTEDWFNTKDGEPNPRCPVCGHKMFKRRIPVEIIKGEVDFDQVQADMKVHGIELRGAGADEAPQVYKKLDDVLSYHEGTIEVLHTLTPVIVCMAGSDEYDPYKD